MTAAPMSDRSSVPRDQDGSLEPQIVATRQKR
jgi:hypothetical protein